jgi:hypothetical protein
VRVYGPGIEHGVLATFQSRFICDTRGAGAGQLTVRVRGPKGAFRVEMQRETQKDRIILCRYDPTEPGDYRVEVRWAGVLVPGSPFPVKIVDTQDELVMLTQVRLGPRFPLSLAALHHELCPLALDRYHFCLGPIDLAVCFRSASITVPLIFFSPALHNSWFFFFFFLLQGTDTCTTGHHTITSWRGSQAIL